MDVFNQCAQRHDAVLAHGNFDLEMTVQDFKGAECAMNTLHYLAPGDGARLLTFVHQVRSVNRSDLDALQAAIKDRDRALMARGLHKMSGAAGLFKYELLAQYCGVMERACANEPWPVLIDLFKRVEWLIQQLDQSLITLASQQQRLMQMDVLTQD